jgi:alpha-ribazole phosphatase
VRLWLVRHARVVLPPGLCYGASDVQADAEHTRHSAEALATVLPLGAALWVSGLLRAQQLADALTQRRTDLGAPKVDARLNEMDFGRWELQPWDAIPRSAFDAWMADFAHHRFGGSESTQQVIDRVAAVLARARATRHADLIWVAHAGVIRAAQFLAANGHQPIARVDQWPAPAPEPGGYIQMAL